MADGSRFEIGKILSRALGLVGTYLPLYLAIAVPLTGVPAFLGYWWQSQYLNGLPPAEMLALFQSREFWQPMGMTWLLAIVTGAIVHAALTRATVKGLAGQAPELGESLETGFTSLLPVVLVSLIVGIGVGLGMVLLIVPGIILWLCWSMAIPVVVQERLGPIEALKRSLALTRGERGNIFLTMLALVFSLWAAGMFIGFVALLFTGGGGGVGNAVAQAFVSAVGAMASTAVTATIYVELRTLKEGGTSSELDKIFS